MTIRLCKACGGWHDLHDAWPDACAAHWSVSATIGGGSIQIIKDIEPYKTAASDIDGKRKVIGSRSEHRSFLRRNGYVEVGNDAQPPKPAQLDLASPRDVSNAIDQIRSRR